MVCTATALLVALKSGPSHLHSQPSVKFHRIFSVLPSVSISMIEPFLRWIFPLVMSVYQTNSSRDSISPQFSVMFVNFVWPGSLRAVNRTSLPSRYSVGSTLAPNPLHSENPAWRIPSISTTKLYARYGSVRGMSATSLSLGHFRRARRDSDPDDDE